MAYTWPLADVLYVRIGSCQHVPIVIGEIAKNSEKSIKPTCYCGIVEKS